MRHPSEHTKYRTLHAADIAAVEELQVEVMRAGRRVIPTPTLDELRSRRAADVDRLDPGIRRLVNPHEYHVSLTQKLWDLKQALIADARQNS